MHIYVFIIIIDDNYCTTAIIIMSVQKTKNETHPTNEITGTSERARNKYAYYSNTLLIISCSF